MPKNAEDIVGRAVSLVDELEKVGFSKGDIFIDPLIQPMDLITNNGFYGYRYYGTDENCKYAW